MPKITDRGGLFFFQSINFQFTLAAYGTFRRLMSSSSYREMSFAVYPMAQGFHVYGKWGIATSNTDAFSVFTDNMLGTSYTISTWTDCCNATAFILVSALDTSSTTVNVTLPPSFSATLTANGQDYTSDFSLTLGLREVVTITSTSDLSGTLVTGDNCILVQSGSNKAAVQGTTKGQLIETLPPLSHQGTVHYGVPTAGRSSDVYRFVSSSDSNTVTIQEDTMVVVTVTLTSSNPVYDYVATNPVIITSLQPLLVTMYSSSDDATVIPPSMTFIPSTSHWASYYVIKECDGSLTRPEYVMLVIVTSYTSGVMMTYFDDVRAFVTGWSTFQSDVTYSYVTLSITQSFVLDHVDSQPFMVIQYGVKASWAYSFVPVFTQTVTPATTTAASTTSTTAATEATTSISNATTTAASTTSTTAATEATTSTSNATTSTVTTSTVTNSSVVIYSNVSASDNVTADSTSSWLDDTTGQVLLGVGGSVTAVGIASFVAWKAVSAHSAANSVTSFLPADVTSPPNAPIKSQFRHAETRGLTIVDI
ncbi:hypothetical protein V1264_007734 [Littorina saxatilis]|uniref:IgGFc-binding protein N-terminal domain-containing protein n=1 Tax=Littorina saxatilis TaxID=31220 RepID=A0AAN9AVK5_9CAEN